MEGFIAEYVKNVILANHTYFKAGNVSEIVLPSGVVLKRDSNGEYTYGGIDDSNGIAFYIRLEPETSIEEGRRVTSQFSPDRVRVRAHLIAYAFGDHKINPHNWAAALANLIREIPFTGYAGPGADIFLQVARTNSSEYDVFLEEVKQNLYTEQEFKSVAVEFDIVYTPTKTCNVCSDIQDICVQSEVPLLPCNCPESGGGGVDCDTLADCQVIIDLQGDVSALQAEIDAEEIARQNADATLQANITAEANARAAADANLQAQINTKIGCGDLPNCATIQTLQAEDANLAADIAQEITDRQNGDTQTLNDAKNYADGLVVGLLDDRGSWDASGNTFPNAGGSGAGGAIKKGDLWFISVGGNLGGEVVTIGDSVRALTDNPGQIAANWNIIQVNIQYVPENVANKDTDGTLAANSDIKYPSQKAVKTYSDAIDTKNKKSSFGITLDGVGGVISVGSKGFIAALPFGFSATHWYVKADQAGDIVIDIKRNGVSIIGAGNKPTLAAAQQNNSAIAGWTNSTLAENDEIEFVVDSAATVTRVNLIIKGNKV